VNSPESPRPKLAVDKSKDRSKRKPVHSPESSPSEKAVDKKAKVELEQLKKDMDDLKTQAIDREHEVVMGQLATLKADSETRNLFGRLITSQAAEISDLHGEQLFHFFFFLWQLSL